MEATCSWNYLNTSLVPMNEVRQPGVKFAFYIQSFAYFRRRNWNDFTSIYNATKVLQERDSREMFLRLSWESTKTHQWRRLYCEARCYEHLYQVGSKGARPKADISLSKILCFRTVMKRMSEKDWLAESEQMDKLIGAQNLNTKPNIWYEAGYSAPFSAIQKNEVWKVKA